MDSSGFLCGSVNTYRNDTEVDLRASPYLYYLNPIDLLKPSNIKYAKSICVNACPKLEAVCNISSLPCLNSTQYRCARLATATLGRSSPPHITST
jgi:hypothetical protein